MTQLSFKNLIGQARIKEALGAAYAKNMLGHAYLFAGEAGVGKFMAALELGMALLCTDTACRPCGECPSCIKIKKNSHPDLHIIHPVSLAKEHKNDTRILEEGWQFISTLVRKKIEWPYSRLEHNGVPSIPVDWIKEVTHAIARGAIEGQRMVIIVCNVDMLSKESSNALLKTLEEPPPGTIMMLLTDRQSAVLPTIASRCQLFRFGCLSHEQILEGLGRYALSDVDNQHIAAAARYAMGSLGTALSLIEHPRSENAVQVIRLFELCREGDWELLGAFIDEISVPADFSDWEALYLQCIYMVRDNFLASIPGSQNYILNNKPTGVPTALNNEDAQGCLRACHQALMAVRAYGNPALVFVNFCISLMEILHGKR